MSNEIEIGTAIEVGVSSEQIIAPEIFKPVEQAPEGEVTVITKVEIGHVSDKKSKKAKSEVAVKAETAVEKPKNKLFYKVIRGGEMTDAEFNKVMKLLSRTDTIKAAGLGDRMRRAEVIVLAKDDGDVIGCMALRENKTGYMRRIIGRSRISLKQNALELCWIRILQTRKNLRIEHEMFVRLAMAVKDEKFANKNLFGRQVFSIWPVEDEYSRNLVESFGFVKTPTDQVSELNQDKRVQMYTFGQENLAIAHESLQIAN